MISRKRIDIVCLACLFLFAVEGVARDVPGQTDNQGRRTIGLDFDNSAFGLSGGEITSVLGDADAVYLEEIRNARRDTLTGVVVRWMVFDESDLSRPLFDGDTGWLRSEAVEPDVSDIVHLRAVQLLDVEARLDRLGKTDGTFDVRIQVLQAQFADGSVWQRDPSL